MKLHANEIRECANCGAKDKKLRTFETDILCYECAKDLLDPEDFREYLEASK